MPRSIQLLLAFGLLLSSVAQGQTRQISITIDDMDVSATTPLLNPDQRNQAILQALENADIHVTIFVCGMRVDHPLGRERLRAWDEAGHLMANHTYSHWFYPRVGFEKFSADVLKGENVIKGYSGFRRWFRFPYLKEGATKTQRDAMRAFLKAHGYRMGYVTIDASDWAIDARLRKRLASNPNADLRPYRDFYLEHVWARAKFYDDLASQVLQRPVKHTLLLHHNLLAALFLEDLLNMFRERGWELIDSEDAFQDPVFDAMPDIAPAGESVIWALAKESQRFESVLRYPGENDTYENARMDELRL